MHHGRRSRGARRKTSIALGRSDWNADGTGRHALSRALVSLSLYVSRGSERACAQHCVHVARRARDRVYQFLNNASSLVIGAADPGENTENAPPEILGAYLVRQQRLTTNPGDLRGAAQGRSSDWARNASAYVRACSSRSTATTQCCLSRVDASHAPRANRSVTTRASVARARDGQLLTRWRCLSRLGTACADVRPHVSELG